MATSGQLNTNTTYDSYFWVKWSQSGDQDIANNRTLIAWSCGVYCGHSFYSNAIKMSGFYINGVLVYSGGTYSNYSKGTHTIASGTMWINHATDGTKTFNISSFTGWLYSNYNYSSNGGSYSLVQIPRGASIATATDFTDQQNPSITYSNPAGNAVSYLMACISLTGATDDIKYRSIEKTGTSYTFALTDAERNLLRNNTTGTSRKVHFYVRTQIGSTFFHSSIEKTFTIDSSVNKPSVGVVVSLNNGSLPSAFNGLYIQGKSRVNVELSVSAAPGAKIQSYSSKVDGKMYYNALKFTSDAIQGSGAVDVVGYATDSRGFSGSASKTINVIAYSKPLVIPLDGQNAILCYRSDASGNINGNSTSVRIKAKRSYYDVSGKNFCALQYRSKLSTESWNDSNHPWKDLISRTSTGNQFNDLLTGVTFDVMKSYTIQVRAIDDIGEYDIKTFEVPTRDVALHLGRGGKNVSIGSYCDYSEDYTFHCEWKAIFDSDIVVKGMTLADYIKSVINEGG